MEKISEILCAGIIWLILEFNTGEERQRYMK